MFMTKINNLQKGAWFGELALINSKPRSATIISEVETECAVLEK